MKQNSTRVLAILTAGLFVATVVLANWTLRVVGILEVAGLAIPSAVLWVGLAFTLRDLLHEWAGRGAVLGAIALGAALSVAVDPALALASGIAFAVSELVDLGVYEPLRRRHWLLAVAVSGLAGLIVDSLIFLQLAFGNLDFLPGQIVGKAAVLALSIALLAPARRALLSRNP